jgi:hypothetical protein
MQPVPTLDELARDPSAAIGLPSSALAALQTRAAAVLLAIGAALATSTAVDTQPAPPDVMLTVDEASARLRRSRQWLYRNAEHLPFVRRLSRKSLLVSETGLNAYLAAKPALRHNGGYERRRPIGKGLGQAAAKPHGANENPRGEGKDFAARAGHNGTRNLSENAP